jgi:transcription regulator MmyB-like protein
MQEFLRNARRQYLGDTVTPLVHDRPRQVALSQWEVALRRGRSLTLVGQQETGKIPIPVHDLDNAAHGYGLTPAGRDELYYLRTGGYPRVASGQPDPEAVSGWEDFIHALTVPSLSVDATWTVLQSNEAWRKLFEPARQAPPKNLMRFVCFAPYARTLLGDWLEGWARPFIHELRLELARHEAVQLQRIATRVQNDPQLTELWETAAAPAATSLHSDGQVRYIKPPVATHLHCVRLLVSSPLHDPRRRVILLNPTPETLDAHNAQHPPVQRNLDHHPDRGTRLAAVAHRPAA